LLEPKDSEYPSVSIITPSFNQALFIEETIQSVLQQNYPNIEYLVMDGGSTDGTQDILHRYDGQLTWVSEPDKGQANAINKGWQRSQGDIIAWLNSDDLYAPGAVRRAVETFVAHPKVAMVYGDNQGIDKAGRVLYTYTCFQMTLEDLLCFKIIGQPTVFLRRKVLDTVGWLDESLHYLLDHDYWIRVAARYEIMYIPYVMAHHRMHEMAKNVEKADRFPQDAFTILEKIQADEVLSRHLEPIKDRAYTEAHLLAAIFYIRKKKWWAILSSIWRAYQLDRRRTSDFVSAHFPFAANFLKATRLAGN
jgi:glycosyltransferase involved in cell wall biosynthesis